MATFDIPEFSDAEMIFGARGGHYIPRDKVPARYDRDKHCEAAQKLFFNGGSLSDFGLQFREGVDRNKAMRAIRALLCSFEPSHEQKIATVGQKLAEWCEPLTEAPKTERKVKKKGKR